MEYRRLGRTGLEVSVIGIGTWQFGGEWGKSFIQQEVDAILGRARDLGINLIDTAECYGDHVSERLVGGAIRHDRDRWIVATKFGHRFHEEPRERTDHWGPDEVIEQLEASLRALDTDRVDIYQFHSGDDAAFDRDELWEALGRQVEKGTVRHLGVSVGRSDNLHQVARAGKVGATVAQIAYSRLDRTAEGALFPSCQEQGLGVIVREALANGYLTGKYRPGDRITTDGDWRSDQDPERVDRILHEVDEIRRVEVSRDVPMASWALAWCLQHPAVTAVIPGVRSVEHVESNAAAAELELW